MDDHRAEVLKRLAANDALRKEERDKKRLEEKDGFDPNESTDAFLATFSEEIRNIETTLEQLKNVPDVKQSSHELLLKLNALDGDVSQAAYYLPPYDVRQSRIKITDLKKKVTDVRDALAPKKKFMFSNKPAIKTSAPKEPSIEEPSIPQTALEQKGLNGKENEDLTITEAELGGRGFVVSDCKECVIRLEGNLMALVLRSLERCALILIGHVQGATMMFGLLDCTIYLASSQIRIHDSKGTTFHLRVRSHPIIENSTALIFKPLHSMEVESISDVNREAMEKASNDLCEENGMWGEVNDFGWLQDTPSPNWYGLLKAKEELFVRMACVYELSASFARALFFLGRKDGLVSAWLILEAFLDLSFQRIEQRRKKSGRRMK